MFDKIGQAAEKMALGVSRRGFLGRAAKLAAGFGAALAGFAAFPSEAQAACGCPRGTSRQCVYTDGYGGNFWTSPRHGCQCPRVIFDAYGGVYQLVWIQCG